MSKEKNEKRIIGKVEFFNTNDGWGKIFADPAGEYASKSRKERTFFVRKADRKTTDVANLVDHLEPNDRVEFTPLPPEKNRQWPIAGSWIKLSSGDATTTPPKGTPAQRVAPVDPKTNTKNGQPERPTNKKSDQNDEAAVA